MLSNHVSLRLRLILTTLAMVATQVNPAFATTEQSTTSKQAQRSSAVTYIATLADLRAMADTGDYELVGNIDASATHLPGQAFEPIATWWFTGTFNGNGYTISNLKIKSGVLGTGLFSGTVDSEIRNVHLENVTVTGDTNVGGIVGWASNTVIEDSSVTGTVTGATGMRPRALAGLIVGALGTKSIVDRCWAQGTVNGIVDSAGGIAGNAGSVAASVNDRPLIRESFANVTISPTFGSPATIAAGGIVGSMQAGRFEDVLSTGTVVGDYAGGIVGAIYYVDNWTTSFLRSGVTHAIVTVNGVPNRTGAIGYYESSNAIGDCRGVLYNTTTDGGSLRPDSTSCQSGMSASELRLPRPAPNPYYFPYIFGSPLPPTEPSYPGGSDGTWNFSAWALNSETEYATLINIPWAIQPK